MEINEQNFDRAARLKLYEKQLTSTKATTAMERTIIDMDRIRRLDELRKLKLQYMENGSSDELVSSLFTLIETDYEGGLFTLENIHLELREDFEDLMKHVIRSISKKN